MLNKENAGRPKTKNRKILAVAIIALLCSAFFCAAFFIHHMFYTPLYEGYDMHKYVTVSDYKALADQASEEEQEAVWQQIIQSCEVLKYPLREKLACEQRSEEYFYTLARGYGYDEDTFDSFLGDAYDFTAEEFADYFDNYVENSLKEELVIHAIAQEEGLDIGDREYADYLDEFLQDARYTPEEFAEEFGMSIEEYAKSINLETSLLKQKVFEQIF